MKLQQLRYLAAIAQNDLNLTLAAARLGATQPAVSKQLKLLEDELGFDIFERKGRSLTRMTKIGEEVVERALRMLREVQGIKGLSDDIKDGEKGSLSIGTTHTQARYVLPEVIASFRSRHPGINVHLQQGTSQQIAEMAAVDRIDLLVDAGVRSVVDRYNLLPCHQWRLCVVVPQGHALAGVQRLTTKDLVAYPLVTYEFGHSESSGLLRNVFAASGLQANVSLTAWDSEVIKTYVRLGLGVGIVSEVAVEPKADQDLVYLDASALFPLSTTWVGFARGTVIRGFVYNFLSLLAPHLTTSLVERAAACTSQDEVDALFQRIRVGSWRSEVSSGHPSASGALQIASDSALSA
jgi:LysR family cys regulon transcriptional activator